MPKWILEEFRGDSPTGFKFPISGRESQVRKALEFLAARHLTNDEILDAVFGANSHLTVSVNHGAKRYGLMTSGTDYHYVATKENDD